jgi:hypothetical protein
MPRKHSSTAPEGTTEHNPGSNGMQQPANKKEAVRLAMAAGVSSPTEIAVFVKKTFGLDMTVAHVNTVKGQLKREKNGKKTRGKPGRKPGRPSTRVLMATPASTEVQPVLTLDELRTLKELAGRVGGVGGLQPFLDLLKEGW